MATVQVKVSQDATTVRRLRQGVGLVGMALPFAVTIGNAINTGNAALLSSISGAYYTSMRDVFVGSLCAIGVFLLFYRVARIDDVLATIAGISAIAVALFPNSPGAEALMVSAADSRSAIVHNLAATVLFISLAAFCFFLFPKSTNPEGKTRRKKARNLTYYICGVVIVAGLALAALGSNVLPDSVTDQVRPLFWGETAAVLAFGVAWFAKSNTFLPDVES